MNSLLLRLKYTLKGTIKSIGEIRMDPFTLSVSILIYYRQIIKSYFSTKYFVEIICSVWNISEISFWLIYELLALNVECFKNILMSINESIFATTKSHA